MLLYQKIVISDVNTAVPVIVIGRVLVAFQRVNNTLRISPA